MIVKPIIHLDTFVLAVGVVVGQLLEHVYLELSGVTILLDILDNLDGKSFVLVEVQAFYHLSECSLAKLTKDLVPDGEK